MAVVTGGSAGVGRATVREFAARGYDVAILARGGAGLDGAAADVRSHGERALPLAVDVADDEAVEGAAMAYRSIPLQAPYCGAKHAVKGFTESVMTELAHEKSGVKLCMVQLPGLNTPQFNWNLSKMPRHPMPVPPIFQPELAAARSCSWPSTRAATCGWASPPPTPSWASGWLPRCSTCIWARPA